MRAFIAAATAVATLLIASMSNTKLAVRVQVTPNESARRVDITIDGKPFTAYEWPESQKKPVLFPLRSATGVVVTRGFPLEPRSGERVDHPHHAGLWFNYGNVNGFDFWNNSTAIKPDDAGKMGTIHHRKIVEAKSGLNEGDLVVESVWITGKDQLVLKEHTKFIFGGDKNSRMIDRITTLQAQSEKVVFQDDKEGLLGMRVTRALEAPSDKPEVFTDASGNATQVAKMDNTGVNGSYLTSEGKKGEAAWGTRGNWCILTGNVGNDPITIAILDHPKNPGHPTYWHARGYGLFAANPLAPKIFTDGKAPAMNFALDATQSVTFRYRVVILSKIATASEAEAAYNSFASSSE
jgi:hypothetical protein